MKNHTNKQFLLPILLCCLSTVAFGLNSCVDRTQEEIPTTKPTQQGFGRAPDPNLTATPTSTKSHVSMALGVIQIQIQSFFQGNKQTKRSHH